MPVIPPPDVTGRSSTSSAATAFGVLDRSFESFWWFHIDSNGWFHLKNTLNWKSLPRWFLQVCFLPTNLGTQKCSVIVLKNILLTFNSSPLEKLPFPNRKGFVFQPPIFRGYLKLWGYVNCAPVEVGSLSQYRVLYIPGGDRWMSSTNWDFSLYHWDSLTELHPLCQAKVCQTNSLQRYEPLKFNMEPEITHLERNMIFQTSMIMFHVNLLGSIWTLGNSELGNHHDFRFYVKLREGEKSWADFFGSWSQP